MRTRSFKTKLDDLSYATGYSKIFKASDIMQGTPGFAKRLKWIIAYETVHNANNA